MGGLLGGGGAKSMLPPYQTIAPPSSYAMSETECRYTEKIRPSTEECEIVVLLYTPVHKIWLCPKMFGHLKCFFYM